jgi:hypothetical protein
VDRTAQFGQPPIWLDLVVEVGEEQMTDKVHVTKHGIQAFEWDGDAGQHLEQKISTALHVLRCACHVDADVTLGDIFRAVEQDPQLVLFLQEWSWCNVDAFHLEARKPTGKRSDLAYIEIAKYFEWDKWEAQETIHVSGIGEGARLLRHRRRPARHDGVSQSWADSHSLRFRRQPRVYRRDLRRLPPGAGQGAVSPVASP